MNKPYEVIGRGRWCGEYWTCLYFRSYNKELAINFAKKHSDSYEVVKLLSGNYIYLYDGDNGIKICNKS